MAIRDRDATETATEDFDAEEQRTFRAFSRGARALFVQFDRDLQRDAGLPRSYFEILWHLRDASDGAMRMSELAALTGSQPSRMTHAVTRLEAAGLVRRELCAEDRRGWNAVLTDEGRATLDQAAPHYRASIRRHFLDPLTKEERRQLTGIFEMLLRALGDTAFVEPPADEQFASRGVGLQLVGNRPEVSPSSRSAGDQDEDQTKEPNAKGRNK